MPTIKILIILGMHTYIYHFDYSASIIQETFYIYGLLANSRLPIWSLAKQRLLSQQAVTDQIIATGY